VGVGGFQASSILTCFNYFLQIVPLSSFSSHLSLFTSVPSESMASQHPIVAGSAKFPKPTDQAFQYGTAGVSQSVLTMDT